MNKKQLKDKIKKIIVEYEEESGLTLDWIKVNRKKSVGFSPSSKGLTISLTFRSG